jgi:hypothetical protein
VLVVNVEILPTDRTHGTLLEFVSSVSATPMKIQIQNKIEEANILTSLSLTRAAVSLFNSLA